MANDIYNYGQRRTSINNPFTGESDWFNNVTEAPMGPGIINTGVGNQFANARRRMTDIPNYLNEPLNTLDPNFHNILRQQNRSRWDQANVPDERGFLGKTRDVIGNQISRFTTPVMSVLNKAFKPNEQMESAIDQIQETGSFGGQRYNIDEARNKIYSEVNPFGKNLRSGFGSNDPTEMDDKTLAWAAERLRTGKGLSQRLRNILQNRGMLDVTGVDRVGGDTTGGGFITRRDTGAPVTTGGGETFAPSMDRDRLGRSRGTWQGATRAREQTFRDTGGQQGQVAGPGFGSGAYWAEGGRVGYQDGELVEDESMFEATPRGMMEENIEEVQGEPSREQLEAISFEIFQLPLEELNEQQLEVVYQAAMEQEPSEEEVQFAAQEGPGEGIASLV